MWEAMCGDGFCNPQAGTEDRMILTEPLMLLLPSGLCVHGCPRETGVEWWDLTSTWQESKLILKSI